MFSIYFKFKKQKTTEFILYIKQLIAKKILEEKIMEDKNIGMEMNMPRPPHPHSHFSPGLPFKHLPS